MAVAQVVDTRINPNNPAQRVVLWGNGRIDVTGGPPVTDGPQWYDRIDQPVAVAIWIVNWTTMAGYVLDMSGGFHKFNGAPSIGTAGGQGTTHEVVNGVAYITARWYVDWSWDPNTPGRGVVLDAFGNVHPFGGAPQTGRVGRRWAAAVARKIVMQWAPDVRAYTLSYDGGIHRDYAAVSVTSPWKWPGSDQAVDLTITDWSTGAGYVLDRNAGVWAFGGAEGTFSPNYKLGADRARALEVLNPDDPLRFWQVWAGGQEFEWTWSTPPTVIAGGAAPQSPASTVTGTTRPVLAWAYSDLQEDAQTKVRLLVFTSAFVGSHTMTDPSVHAASAVVNETLTDPMLRGIASPVDLPNGGYSMYVRAQDAAGQWSPWSSRAWTQNVPVPATPTGLTATANDAAATVTLTVTADPAGNAELVRFEFSDDPAALANPDDVSWFPVRTADAVPIAASVTGVDWDARLGVQRAYRAVAYSIDPRTASLPSTTAQAILGLREHVLTAVDDPELGGVVLVVEAPGWTRPVSAGVFEGLGSKYPTVVSDGAPKARRQSLTLEADGRDEWTKIEGLLLSDSVLVYRDPFGDVMYCRVAGDWTRQQQRAAPRRDEGTPFRHLHRTTVQLIEVRPPHLPA